MAFLAQDHHNYEVIVVDDRSTDGSHDYLFSLQEEHPHLKIVRIDATPDHMNHKKYAIIMGMKAASHELLLLSDADCWPISRGWVSAMNEAFEDESVKMVLGYSQYFPLKSLLHFFIGYETLMTGVNYITYALLGRPYMGVGRNMAYRKSLFMEMNGFGKYRDVVGGDDDLLVQQHAHRKNTRIRIGKDAMVYSLPKKDLKSYWIQKKRHLSVGKLYRSTDKLLLGLQFMFKVLFWGGAIAVTLSGILTQNVLLVLILTLLLQLAAILFFKWRAADKAGIWLMPLLDIVFIFYYISSGLAVLFTKKIKWK
jgi:cellulose synthase/poly-beta-1,6-N-acetylglucosamine synthase-like glycosyltransferase